MIAPVPRPVPIMGATPLQYPFMSQEQTFTRKYEVFDMEGFPESVICIGMV